MAHPVHFVELAVVADGACASSATCRAGVAARRGTDVVFLHEGLGSVAMWRDFPQRTVRRRRRARLRLLAPRLRPLDAARARASAGVPTSCTARPHELLPALFADIARRSRRPPLAVRPQRRRLDRAAACRAHPPTGRRAWSRSRRTCSSRTSRSPASSRRATAYERTDLRQRLARYHDDPDSAFCGWNDVWLHPPFADWNIEAEIAAIACPLLAVQGEDDEYGTLAADPRDRARVPHTVLVELPACGHSPHRDQPAARDRRGRRASSMRTIEPEDPNPKTNARPERPPQETHHDPHNNLARCRSDGRRGGGADQRECHCASAQAQGRPDAALHRHLRRAGHGDRERLQALRERARRQARPAARSSTSRSTTSPIPPRRPTTSTS